MTDGTKSKCGCGGTLFIIEKASANCVVGGGNLKDTPQQQIEKFRQYLNDSDNTIFTVELGGLTDKEKEEVKLLKEFFKMITKRFNQDCPE